MKRTQIYLEDEQDRLLDERARARGTTKSHLIRDALDAYLGLGASEEGRLTAFRAALRGAFGKASYLPDGASFVREVRRLDVRRQEALERRRAT